jgi:hypothetical protein
VIRAVALMDGQRERGVEVERHGSGDGQRPASGKIMAWGVRRRDSDGDLRILTPHPFLSAASAR